MKFINTYNSPNYNRRKKFSNIRYIIIHYTAMNNEKEAINYLINKNTKVSSHFLINKLGSVYKLVDLKNRAWHAGLASWKNIKDINSHSLGIELDNTGNQKFQLKQIQSLILLLSYLTTKYKINKNCILGHSDISPYRKIDPGKKFPWNILASKKFTILPKIPNINISLKIENYLNKQNFKSKKQKVLFMLKKIGYDIKPSLNNTQKYKNLIKAYQMHYKNNIISGIVDKETYEVIKDHYNQLLTI